MNKQLTKEFMSAFQGYLGEVAKMMKKRFSGGEGIVVTFKEGSKFIKVIETSGFTNRESSVHSFVEISTGNVLKPATWNAPAKHSRGNIFDADKGRSALVVYGIRYLK